MRFGCEAYLYLHSDNLFSYFLEKGLSVLGRFFPARPQLFARRKRVARCRNTTVKLTTNCAAGNAANAGETSPAPSATSVSLLSKLPTIMTRSGLRLPGSLQPGADFAASAEHVALLRVAAAACGI